MPADLPIRTRSLLLRQLTPRDAGAIFVLANEDAYRTWLPSQTYASEAQALSAVELLVHCYSTTGNPRQGPYVLAIEHRADGSLIGHVGFSPLGGEVEIGFAVARAYQRRGLATEAIVAASDWAFREFDLDRILGVAASENTASMRALARAGFVYEGARTMSFQGTEQDVRIYALSRGVRNEE